MTQKRSYFGYNILVRLIKFAGNLYFGGKVIGKENIPQNGPVILAGNHTSDFDSYLLFKSTKRKIHIVAKKELLKSKFSFIFKAMHLIPVDRSKKNPEAKNLVCELLKSGKVIGIFPEGTYHKQDILLPFKPGAISFAEKTNSPIVPFVIVGSFKFRSHPKIVFGHPLDVTKIKTVDKVKYLENLIRNMYIKENSSPK